MRKPHEKHGMSNTMTYHSWMKMIYRTTNKSFHLKKESRRYRTITVCDRWRYSFIAFLEDMGERPSHEYSLDRIENTKGYFPGNCRWALMKTQQRNKSEYNVSVEYCGFWNKFQTKTYLICELQDLTGIDQKIIRTRLKQGMSIQKALIPFNFLTGEHLGIYN